MSAVLRAALRCDECGTHWAPPVEPGALAARAAREAATRDGWQYRNGRDRCPGCRRDPAPCGTPAAYSRHIYRREEPCGPCRQAHAGAQRQWHAGMFGSARRLTPEQQRAARSVAAHATSPGDCRDLLDALGLKRR